jgi:hypothetical protein
MTAELRFRMDPKHNESGRLCLDSRNNLIEIEAMFYMEGGRAPGAFRVWHRSAQSAAIILS